MHRITLCGLLLTVCLLGTVPAEAADHREAPAISRTPALDSTDLFIFQSYSPGDGDLMSNDRTVLIANYYPLQDPGGGPNFFFLPQSTLYEIHIDNTGDGVEDITFQFRFNAPDQASGTFRNLTVETDDSTRTEIPLVVLPGIVDSVESANLNIVERYTLTVVTGDRRTGIRHEADNVGQGGKQFVKPIDNVGQATIPNYNAYAAQHIHEFTLPGALTGDVFVGQRKDPFVVNLGEVFDGLTIRTADKDAIAAKNVTSFAIEVPTAFLQGAGQTQVIGCWTTASQRQARLLNPFPEAGPGSTAIEGGAFTQVSRLGSPLVNELVIGLSLKDHFNASEPKDDAQFMPFFTNPAIAVLLNLATPGLNAPSANRADLVEVFTQGLDLPNPGGPSWSVASEMLRLDVTIPPVDLASQNTLGVLGGDDAGYPNGRRPADDVVDIVLQVAGGVLAGNAQAQNLTDQVQPVPGDFQSAFPFLNDPIPGNADLCPQPAMLPGSPKPTAAKPAVK